MKRTESKIKEKTQNLSQESILDELPKRRSQTFEDKIRNIEERQKKRNIYSAIFISIVVMLILIITTFFLLNIMKSSMSKPRYSFVQEGSIDHMVTTEGVFFRDEKVYKAPDNGYLKPFIQSGSRTSFGQTVAVVIRDESDADYLTLKNYEKQISELQMSLMLEGRGTGASAIFRESQEDISAQIDLVRRDAIKGDLSSLANNRTSIQIAIKSRENRLMGVDFNDSRLNDLQKKKRDLENKLEYISGNVIVDIPGIVSYVIDGYEVESCDDTVDTLSMDDHKNLIQKDNPESNLDKYIEKGIPAAKVISGLNQYIVAIIPSDQDEIFREDSIHNISVESKGVEIENCMVYRKFILSDESLIIFKTNRQISRFVDYRHIDISLKTRSTRGAKLPYSSVFDMDKTKTSGSVFLVVNGFIEKVQVDIIDYDTDFVIAKRQTDSADKDGVTSKNTLMGSYVVTNPQTVKEGDSFGP